MAYADKGVKETDYYLSGDEAKTLLRGNFLNIKILTEKLPDVTVIDGEILPVKNGQG